MGDLRFNNQDITSLLSECKRALDDIRSEAQTQEARLNELEEEVRNRLFTQTAGDLSNQQLQNLGDYYRELTSRVVEISRTKREVDGRLTGFLTQISRLANNLTGSQQQDLVEDFSEFQTMELPSLIEIIRERINTLSSDLENLLERYRQFTQDFVDYVVKVLEYFNLTLSDLEEGLDFNYVV